MKVLIKCADIGHTAKKTALHEKWSRLVIEEFNNQAKLEEEQNLPITMPTLKTSSELGKS